MTTRDFCYWLQGYLEIMEHGPGTEMTLNESQLVCIRNHLSLVFVHDVDGPDPDGKLQAAHDGKAKAKPKLSDTWPGRPPGARC